MTAITGSTLGNSSVAMMRAFDWPVSRAAAMKSACRKPTVAPRTARAKKGTFTITMATIACPRLGPSAATIAKASSR